jgi:uncharacterized coiled-coil protein SlyX
MPMSAKIETYEDNTLQLKDPTSKAAPPAAEGASLEQAMQRLFSLVGLMRDMTPQGAAAGPSPTLILTASGLELRYGSPESPSTSERSDRIAGLESSVKLLSERVAKLEEELSFQSTELESLRTSVKQNEELIEAVVDSISVVNDLSFGQDDLVRRPKTLAS